MFFARPSLYARIARRCRNALSVSNIVCSYSSTAFMVSSIETVCFQPVCAFNLELLPKMTGSLVGRNSVGTGARSKA
jgi:hypothetical protein